jgi:Domain of unknown function (DUF4136)
MTPSRRWGWAAALVAAGAVATIGCATMQVHSYVHRGEVFSRYHTYAWAPEDQLRTGDPRLDNNPFFLRRLESDVDRHLAGRGLEKVATDASDLVIHYHVSITQEINANQLDTQYGYRCDDCEPYVYDSGTLLIDLVDARSNQLVWRGWSEGTMDNAIDNQDFMEQRIDEAVGKILARLPGDL